MDGGGRYLHKDTECLIGEKERAIISLITGWTGTGLAKTVTRENVATNSYNG
jgi:hypothetical protein